MAGQFAHIPCKLKCLVGQGSTQLLFNKYPLWQLKQVVDELTQVLQRPTQPTQVCEGASIYKPLPHDSRQLKVWARKYVPFTHDLHVEEDVSQVLQGSMHF